MSLHAAISAEAQAALDSQKKKSTAYSIIIAVLACVLLGIILSIFVLTAVTKKAPELVSYQMGIAEVETTEQEEITNQVTRQPTAPSTASSVITADASSDISAPTVDFSLEEATLDMGIGDDFGLGLDGTEFASEALEEGSAGGFGSSIKVKGTIEGRFYDFKQTPEGEENKRYKPMAMSNVQEGKGMGYPRAIREIRNSKFADSSFSDYYKAERPLYARYIAIPQGNAAQAPRQFGQQGKVEPSNWLIHYKGKVQAPKAGRFRFVGAGDDMITVNVNRRTVFTDSILNRWVKNAVSIKGKSSGEDALFRDKPVSYGSWFEVREGEIIDIDIAISEGPGGHMSFILAIEEKGAEYRKTADGFNILPPFSMGNLTPQDKGALNSFKGWQWETQNVPVFLAVEE